MLDTEVLRVTGRRLDLKGRATIWTPGSGERMVGAWTPGTREEGWLLVSWFGPSSPARVIWLPPAPSAPLHSTE